MANKLVKGAFILSVATFLTKLLGSLFWFPFQNIAGSTAVGIYRLSFPIYAILLMVASAGIPITVSKFVAEKLSEGDHYGARRIFRAAALILSLTGLIFGASLYFSADYLATKVLHNKDTILSLQILAIAIVVVPVMGAFRGYFQGYQDMMPTGMSQVVEQILRVGIVIGLTYWMVQANYSNAEIAAGATAGAFVGAIGGLLVVLWYDFRHRRQYRRELAARPPRRPESFRSICKKILWYALPISVATLVLPLINLIDSVTVPGILKSAGFAKTAEDIDNLFGIYSRSEPFVNLISTFSASITLALIPAITAHVAKKEMLAVKQKVNQAWLMTMVTSLPSCFGIVVLAEAINIAMYGDAQGTEIMMVLTFTSIFSTMAVTSSGILQGLGYNKIPVRNLLIGAGVKVIGNFIFVPFMSITGSALSMVLAYVVVCVLNMWMVVRKTNTSVQVTNIIIKPFISALGMAGAVWITYESLMKLFVHEPSRITYAILTLLLVLVGVIVYAIMLLLTRTIGESEIRTLPMGGRMVQILSRLHLIRRTESNSSV